MDALSLEERTKALEYSRGKAAIDAPGARLGRATGSPSVERKAVAAVDERMAAYREQRDGDGKADRPEKAAASPQARPEQAHGERERPPIRDPEKHDFRPPGYSMGMGPTPPGAMIGTITSRKAMLNEWDARRSHDASRGPDDENTRGG